MSFLIVGASAGLGRELARTFAQAGHDLVLVSSDARDISAVAHDVAIRHGVRVRTVVADVGYDDQHYVDLIETAITEIGPIEGCLFPVGAAMPDDDGGLPISDALWLTRTNYLSIVSIVSRLLPRLSSVDRGIIVGFGSVAATRGRANNVIYAAAKRALGSYFESLRHACVGTRVLVQFYVVGYLSTSQAFRPTVLPKGDPSALAARVYRYRGRDFGIAYYPSWWRYVALLVRAVPWSIFRRLAF